MSITKRESKVIQLHEEKKRIEFAIKQMYRNFVFDFQQQFTKTVSVTEICESENCDDT